MKRIGIVWVLSVLVVVVGCGDDDKKAAGPDPNSNMLPGTAVVTDPAALFVGTSCGSAACTVDQACNTQTMQCEALATFDLEKRSQNEVCTRFKERLPKQDLSKAVWTGDISKCELGVWTDRKATMQDVLRYLNAMRWMVGAAPNVVEDADSYGNVQSCAVVMVANNKLNHEPPNNFKCMDKLGAQAKLGAGSSNLSSGVNQKNEFVSPSLSIWQWMQDGGGNVDVGHRRWILNQPLKNFAFGWAEGPWNNTMYPDYNENVGCGRVFDTSGITSRSWTAFPNPGPTPIEFALLDLPAIEQRWSFHSSQINLNGASVSVTNTANDTAMAITVSKPVDGYGEPAIAWVPMGWVPAAGESYRVTVKPQGAAEVSYVVNFVTCS